MRTPPSAAPAANPSVRLASASSSTHMLDSRFGLSLNDLRAFNLWHVDSPGSTSTTGSLRTSSCERTPSVRSNTFGVPLPHLQSSNSAKRLSYRPPSRSSLLPSTLVALEAKIGGAAQPMTSPHPAHAVRRQEELDKQYQLGLHVPHQPVAACKHAPPLAPWPR
jgi:hypothetical protein